MRKIRYYHEDAKKEHKLNRVHHTFLDGRTVSQAEVLDAEIELKAFFIFNGLRYDVVRNGLRGYAGIPIHVLIAPCSATTPEALEAAADKEANTSMPPRIYEGNLTALEWWNFQQGKTTWNQLAIKHYKRGILGCLHYIAERKDQWTLLGIKSEPALTDRVRQCFGPQWVRRMRKDDCLPSLFVQLLLARRTREGTERIEKAQHRRTVSRAEAAKKGHMKRPSGSKTRP